MIAPPGMFSGTGKNAVIGFSLRGFGALMTTGYVRERNI
jgi:hypothetical protein